MINAKVIHRDEHRVSFDVEDIGYVSVMRIEPGTPNNPSNRPWHLITTGRTFETPELALAYMVETWGQPEAPIDRSYELMEARMISPGVFED